MAIHLVCLRRQYLDQILRGEKTCESRLSRRLHPARLSEPGDLLLLKSGPVRGVVQVTRVERYEAVGPTDIDRLADIYTAAVDGPVRDDAYWVSQRDKRYAVFLWLAHPHACFIASHSLPSSRWGWVANITLPPTAQHALHQSLNEPHIAMRPFW